MRLPAVLETELQQPERDEAVLVDQRPAQVGGVPLVVLDIVLVDAVVKGLEEDPTQDAEPSGNRRLV
jgi:hypothetical protein